MLESSIEYGDALVRGANGGGVTVIYGSIDGVGDKVSRIVLGTVSFFNDRAEIGAELLDRFVTAGGTAIDTARSYAQGESEAVVATWLKARGRRDDVVIITKGAHPTADDNRRVNPREINSDLLKSLDTLGIETIDLWLLHRDDPTVEVGPIMDELNQHLAAGRVRAIGASNWSTARIDEANAYAKDHGLRGFTVSSPNLALAVPSEAMWPGCVYVSGDSVAFDWYRVRQFPLLSWSSQASGFFTGRFAPGEISDPHVARVYDRPDNWERLRRVKELAARYNHTSNQVALAWVIRQPLPTFAAVGPLRLPELDDSLGALTVPLTDADVAWLNLA